MVIKRSSKIVFHLSLWILSFVFLYNLFTIDYESGLADLIYTALFHIPLVVGVYLHVWTIRSFFSGGRYLFYLTSLLSILFFCIALYFFIFRVIVPAFLSGYFFIAYYTPWEIAQFIAVYLFLSLLLHLSVGWFFLKEKELQLQRENHQVQLKNLKSQINPHFLFNSLNNIYALADEGGIQTRNYLTRLSDALRYIIYDTDADFVPLKNEVEYLDNYFEIEKLRINQTGTVTFIRTGKFDQYLIAPLLLLPIVENCFSHCNRQTPYIAVSLLVENEVLTFKAINNKDQRLTMARGGVGLRNVEKRLNLIYGDKSTLKMDNSPDLFTIQLVINLSEQ